MAPNEPRDGFTAGFILRKCDGCSGKNIVKDGWYGCGVCGSALSADWNFTSRLPTLAPN
jgi:hypothetical protein